MEKLTPWGVCALSLSNFLQSCMECPGLLQKPHLFAAWYGLAPVLAVLPTWLTVRSPRGSELAPCAGYLDGVEFTVVTDHSPNTFFATKALLSPRQARWAERLSRFQFFWEYRPGRINVADPLSRRPSFSADMVSATIITAELAQLSLCSVTDADTIAENDEAAAADIEMLSQIYRGYETDP